MSTTIETRLVQPRIEADDSIRPMSTPIYQTATFEQPGATGGGAYDYSRSGNPTRDELEARLAELEGAERAFTFASGMAAITAVARLVPRGGEIVAGDDLYGGTLRLLGNLERCGDVTVRYVDATDPVAVDAVLSSRTSLVLVETPTNPLLRICDIAALAERAHAHGALLVVDNSLMSGYLQRPLEVGADVTVQSATKIISGHGDVVAGVVATSDPWVAERVGWIQNAEGAGLGPFESWLLCRSLKTLAVRVRLQAESTARVAEFLDAHDAVRAVHYPGLEAHPGQTVHAAQSSGAGPLLSIETVSRAASAHVVEATRLFRIAVSFGGVCSVISLPDAMSHASVPEARRRQSPLPGSLVRMSVGLEDPSDLIADLDRALVTASCLRDAVSDGSPHACVRPRA